MASNHHMQAGSVRAFILGLLDEEAAAAAEERCFSDRAYFLSVQSEERKLIADYVAGRLPSDEERAFQAQTRKLPALMQEVEVARAEHEMRTFTGGRRRLAVLALSASALVAAIASLWVVRDHTQMTILDLPIPPLFPAVPVKVLNLPAGTYMNGGSGVPHLARTDDKIQARIDLPGRTTPLTGRIRVWLLSADGVWKEHWTGDEQVRSQPTPQGQEMYFELAGSQLPAGEYRAEIVSDPPSQAGYRRFRIDKPRN